MKQPKSPTGSKRNSGAPRPYDKQTLCDHLREAAKIASEYVEDVVWTANSPIPSIKTQLQRLSKKRSKAPAELAVALLPDELLATLPFGDQLVESMAVYKNHNDHERNDPEGQRVHVIYVLAGIHGFLEKSPSLLPRKKEDELPMAHILDAAKGVLDSETAKSASSVAELRLEVTKLLPLMALYHDIGKSLGVENHPTNGYEILRSNEAELRRLVGARSKTLEQRLVGLFLTYVRYHDLWGNVATGEAGLPLLSLVLSPTEIDARINRLTLLLMLVGNLSDAYGAYQGRRNSVHPKPSKLDSLSINRIQTQWTDLDLRLGEGIQAAGLESMWDHLVMLGGRAAEPPQRLHLLLQKSGVSDANNDLTNLITQAFNALSPYEVTARLATVRFAYAMRFVSALNTAVTQNEGKPGFTREALVDRVCDMVAQLCAQYAAQIEYYSKRHVVTVIELAALRPADYKLEPKSAAERFTKTLVDSMFERPRNIWLSRILDLVSIRPGR